MSLEIEVKGQSGNFAAQTVDISRSGALVWVTDERFAPGEKATNMVFYSERVADEFGAVVGIQFGSAGIRRDAEVIRVTRKGPNGGGPILVAFRFANPLAVAEASK
ncbi:MAG: PilZ domain-containing protein, partial [Planctomycetes bacterium]|nr:PilZ domain-containing protein [Planctomycetota bacterium]